MLQNDPVISLHFDNEIRSTQQTTHLDSKVFDGSNIGNITTSQPRCYSNASTKRCTSPPLGLPISTVAESVPQRHHNRNRHNIKAGYEILTNLPSIHIEQSFELNDSLTEVSPENRYLIRTPLDETIFTAIESSTRNSRLLCGASRPFQMHLLDQAQQEAILFRKKFRLGSVFCQPKTLEVWIPPGYFLGRIVQSPTFFRPEFYVEDGETGEPLFCVEGPDRTGFCCFCLPKESFFKIHSGGKLRASIDHKWLTTKARHTTNIYFSDSKLTSKEKSLILGVAILMEYTYFQKAP